MAVVSGFGIGREVLGMSWTPVELEHCPVWKALASFSHELDETTLSI